MDTGDQGGGGGGELVKCSYLTHSPRGMLTLTSGPGRWRKSERCRLRGRTVRGRGGGEGGGRAKAM